MCPLVLLSRAWCLIRPGPRADYAPTTHCLQVAYRLTTSGDMTFASRGSLLVLMTVSTWPLGRENGCELGTRSEGGRGSEGLASVEHRRNLAEQRGKPRASYLHRWATVGTRAARSLW